MKTLSKEEIPDGYQYYRSASVPFRHYTTTRSGTVSPLEFTPNGWFGVVRHFFWRLFSIAVFEKTAPEPTDDFLTEHGMKRGLVVWSPWNRSTPPSGWKKLPTIFRGEFNHSTRSSFSILEDMEYPLKWSSKARGHLRKIRNWQEEGTIRIEQVGVEEYLNIYATTRLPHSQKKLLAWRQRWFAKRFPENFRYYLAYVNGVPLAGGVFLDFAPTSVYLIAFLDSTGKPYHLGTAIIDRWFADSYRLGLRFLDFDHMRDTGDSKSYQGYTTFKEEFADYEVFFREIWYRWK